MRTVVLCLNFLSVALAYQARSGQGNKMLTSDAMIGNAGLVNVLKTTD